MFVDEFICEGFKVFCCGLFGFKVYEFGWIFFDEDSYVE